MARKRELLVVIEAGLRKCGPCKMLSLSGKCLLFGHAAGSCQADAIRLPACGDAEHKANEARDPDWLYLEDD